MSKTKLLDNGFSIALIILLFAGEILTIYETWLLFVVISVYFLVKNRFRIRRFNSPSSIIIFILSIWGFLLGIFRNLKGNVGFWPVARDAIIVSLVPLFWNVSNNIEKQFEFDENIVFNSVFLYSAIISMYSVLAKVIALLSNNNSFYAFRANGNIGEITLSLGFYMIFFKPKACKLKAFGREIEILAKISILFALAISFSRTAYLLLICMFSIAIWKKMKTLFSIVFLFAIGVLFLRYFFPNFYSIFIQKIINSVSELNYRYSYWTDTMIVSDWRGYEVFCTLLDFNNSNFFEQLFGKGFGSSIDVNGYAYLVTSENSIPFLHNGYFTTLFKFGIIGEFLMISYYLCFLQKSIKIRNRSNKDLAVGLSLCIFISTALTSGIIWRGIELPVFVVLSCLFNNEKRIRVSEELEKSDKTHYIQGLANNE